MDIEPLPPESTEDDAGPMTDPGGRRWSRRATVGTAALALAVAGVGGWAVGTTVHPGASTVRFQPAAAQPAATGQAPAPGPAGPRRMGPGGGLGTVTGTPTANSFTISRPVRPAPNGSATPSTPSTSTVTVHVNGTTQYQQVQTSTGAVAGLVGDRIVATGTRAAGGTLQATSLLVVPAPPKGAPARPATTATPKLPNKRTAPPNAGQAPFATGMVTADTPAGVLTVTTPWGTETVATGTGTTTYRVVPATASTLVSGDRVLVQGQRAADGTVTATRVTIVPAGVNLPALAPFARGRGFGRGFGHRPGAGPWHAGPGARPTTAAA